MYIPTTTLSQQLAAGIDGWVNDTANAWTFASATTFTVTGDRTVVFSKGTRLQLTQTTVKYFVVVASSFAAGNTTVTITGGADYTFANAAVSANYYSYAVNPQGYPVAFSWVPTFGGFSAAPSSVNAYFQIVGRWVLIYLQTAAGTSNANTFTFTVPVTCLIEHNWIGAQVTNNSVLAAAPGLVRFNTGSVTVDVFRDGAATVWTTSGSKNANVGGAQYLY